MSTKTTKTTPRRLTRAQIWEAFITLTPEQQQATGLWIVLCAEANAEAEAQQAKAGR